MKRTITRQAAKDKGKEFQQWACKMVSELTGIAWGPPGTDMPIEPRASSQIGCDVRLESHVRELFPFSVECKRQESWSVHEWIEQAKANEAKGTDWLILAKRSHKNPVAIIDAAKFFNILKELRETKLLIGRT